MTMVYDSTLNRWMDRPTPSSSAAPSGVSLMGNTYVQTPGAQQTVEGRLNSLLAGDNQYVQQAESGARSYAASRGLTNSTLAAQAGRSAAIQSALPIATADAQLSSQAAARNADALNATLLTDAQKQMAIAASGGGGSVSGQFNQMDSELQFGRQQQLMRLENQLARESAAEDRTWRSGESGLDRGLTRDMTTGEWRWRSDESALDRGLTREESALGRGLTREGWQNDNSQSALNRDFQATQAQLDRQHQTQLSNNDTRSQMFGNVFSQVMGTLFSSPDYWRDPAGASGFMNFFTGQFGDIFNRFFGQPPTGSPPAGG